MLIINVYSKIMPEKEYIIDVIINQFLGLNYVLNYTENINTEIVLPNASKITIADHFFSSFNGTYQLGLLPKDVRNYESKFGNLICIYGVPNIEHLETEINIDLDILSSSFFMLSRWEESVIEERDEHNRISASSTVAVKYNFLNRPIVNEYVEFIWGCLSELGITECRKLRKFNIIPTHDVDLPKMWWSLPQFVRNLAGDIFKRKSLIEFISTIKLGINKVITGTDPFDTFDDLMSRSEDHGLKSHFFFMSGGTSNKDNFYSIDHPFIVSLIRIMKERNHHIGFHPSYNAYNDIKQFEKEKNKLESIVLSKVVTGRHHFLRFDIPKTWKIWEENSMEWDSTMSYADRVGFRCGVCYPFAVFDIDQRRQLTLLERPLIFMEGSIVAYQNLGVKEALMVIRDLKNQVYKYNGEFIFLWHNSAFATRMWRDKILLLDELYLPPVE